MFIVYDNDDAGRKGGIKLATQLLQVCHNVVNCTAFHTVCVEKGEDLTDFFNKYGKTRQDLISFMNSTPAFTKEDAVKTSNTPLLTLQEATDPKNINRLIRSNIQVSAVSETQYALPRTLQGEKIKETTAPSEVMHAGEVREWELSEDTLQDVLHLVDNNFTSKAIKENAKELLHIPKSEKYVSVKFTERIIVYKAYVTEMIESTNTNTSPLEYVCYSIGTRLESGKKYLVTHKLVPHPYKGQQLVMIVTDVVTVNDSIGGFKVISDVIETLKEFE